MNPAEVKETVDYTGESSNFECLDQATLLRSQQSNMNPAEVKETVDYTGELSNLQHLDQAALLKSQQSNMNPAEVKETVDYTGELSNLQHLDQAALLKSQAETNPVDLLYFPEDITMDIAMDKEIGNENGDDAAESMREKGDGGGDAESKEKKDNGDDDESKKEKRDDGDNESKKENGDDDDESKKENGDDNDDESKKENRDDDESKKRKSKEDESKLEKSNDKKDEEEEEEEDDDDDDDDDDEDNEEQKDDSEDLFDRSSKRFCWDSDVCKENVNLRYLLSLEAKGNKHVLDWCRKYKLISSHYICPTCKSLMDLVPHSESVDNFYWLCHQVGKNEHDVQRSVRKGSWLERSEYTLSITLKMTYFWVHKCSSKFISEEVDVPLKSVTDWSGVCREVCEEYYHAKSLPVGGEDAIVEVDYCTFSNTGRGRLVLGALERGSNRCYFEVVSNRNKQNLISLVKNKILPGTTIISECWKTCGYATDKEFKDLTVSQCVTFKKTRVMTDTNCIKGAWGALKRMLRESNYVNSELESHLAEYVWRKSYASKPSFSDFISLVTSTYPPHTSD